MKLALVQMEIKEKNCAGNTRHGLELLREAARHSELVILPEIWTTGYSLGRLKEEAITLSDPLFAELASIARENNCFLLPGSLPVNIEGKIYNLLPAIDKKGHIVHQYSKAHLFGLFEEERFFAAGHNFKTYHLGDICCGSTICYDLRFPELYRHLALQGAQLIVCPAEWPSLRGAGFDLLSRARAFENHLYVAAVNCVGTFKNAPFYGHSRLIDPLGRIVAEGGTDEEIIYAELDLARITRTRSVLNALQDVRLSIQEPRL